MTSDPIPDRYSASLRLLHWGTVLAVLITYGLTYAEGLFERGSAGREFVWWAHISFGLLVLVFVFVRIPLRVSGAAPGPSPELSRLVQLASAAAHGLLYVLLLATPIVGIYLAFLRGNEVSFFGLFAIPSPIAVNRELARQVIEVHETLANALVLLAALHALAALGHHFVLHDNVLRRMLPPPRAR